MNHAPLPTLYMVERINDGWPPDQPPLNLPRVKIDTSRFHQAVKILHDNNKGLFAENGDTTNHGYIDMDAELFLFTLNQKLKGLSSAPEMTMEELNAGIAECEMLRKDWASVTSFPGKRRGYGKRVGANVDTDPMW